MQVAIPFRTFWFFLIALGFFAWLANTERVADPFERITDVRMSRLYPKGPRTEIFPKDLTLAFSAFGLDFSATLQRNDGLFHPSAEVQIFANGECFGVFGGRGRGTHMYQLGALSEKYSLPRMAYVGKMILLHPVVALTSSLGSARVSNSSRSYSVTAVRANERLVRAKQELVGLVAYRYFMLLSSMPAYGMP